jgi:hypothetical protein
MILGGFPFVFIVDPFRVLIVVYLRIRSLNIFVYLDIRAAIDLISYSFCRKYKLKEALFAAVSITAANKLGIPYFRVYWVNTTMVDSKGTIRRFRRAYIAVKRNNNLNKTLILFS